MNQETLGFALSATPVCEELMEDEILALADAGEVREMGPGTSLSDGRPELIVLLDGEAELERSVEGGPRQKLRIGPGTVLNLLPFLGGSGSRETTCALMHVQVFALDRRRLDRHPAAAKVGLAIARVAAKLLDQGTASLLRLMGRNEALQGVMDHLLTDEKAQTELFQAGFQLFERSLGSMKLEKKGS